MPNPPSLNEPKKGGPIMNQKQRIHDAIVGAVVTAGVALGYYVWRSKR
jgi:hypothetical protein